MDTSILNPPSMRLRGPGRGLLGIPDEEQSVLQVTLAMPQGLLRTTDTLSRTSTPPEGTMALWLMAAASAAFCATSAFTQGTAHSITHWVALGTASAALGMFLRLLAIPSPIPSTPSRTQLFGDMMASEGQVDEIWKAYAATYAMLAFWSALTSVATGCSLVVMPFYYLCGMAAFWLWHFLAHRKGSWMHAQHMRHHITSFNTDDFYGDRSRALEHEFTKPPRTLLSLMSINGAMTNTVQHEGPLGAAMVLIVVLGHFLLGTSVSSLAFVFVGYLIMAAVGSAMHMAFHVRGFELEPYAWFRQLRMLHLIHHAHHVNYAMVNLHADQVAGSFQITSDRCRALMPAS